MRINLKEDLKCLAMHTALTNVHGLKLRIRLCIERSFACSASARLKKKLPQVEKPEFLSTEAIKNAGVLSHGKTQSALDWLIG